MPDLDRTILDLRKVFEAERAARQTLRDTRDADLSAARRDELLSFAEAAVKNYGSVVRRTLEDLLRFPPHHVRHFSKLSDFDRDASYEKSVFVMTKFPEGDDSVDVQLQAVLDAVVESIKQCGYEPRLASDRRHHPLLWDNVELYLLGSSRGVAIVEDRYKPELNPNVAMEWGWMRGMGKDVLYLVEESFSHDRADWSGLIEERFCWERPREQIPRAVEKWLGERRT